MCLKSVKDEELDPVSSSSFVVLTKVVVRLVVDEKGVKLEVPLVLED